MTKASCAFRRGEIQPGLLRAAWVCCPPSPSPSFLGCHCLLPFHCSPNFHPLPGLGGAWATSVSGKGAHASLPLGARRHRARPLLSLLPSGSQAAPVPAADLECPALFTKAGQPARVWDSVGTRTPSAPPMPPPRAGSRVSLDGICPRSPARSPSPESALAAPPLPSSPLQEGSLSSSLPSSVILLV